MYFNPLHVYVPPSDSSTLSIVNVPFRNALILPADSEWSSWPVLLYHLINVVSFFRVQRKVSLEPMPKTSFSICKASLLSTIINTVSAQIGKTPYLKKMHGYACDWWDISRNRLFRGFFFSIFIAHDFKATVPKCGIIRHI